MINATSSMAFSDGGATGRGGGSSGSYHRTPTKNHRTSSSMGQNNNNHNNNSRISRNSNSIDYYFGTSNSNSNTSSTTSGSTPSSSCSPIHQFEYDFFLKSLVVGCGGGGGGESNYSNVARSNPGYLRTMSAINQATSFQQQQLQQQQQQPLYHSPSLSLASPPVKRNSNTSASYHHHSNSHHSHRNRNVRSQTAANTPTNPNQNFADHLFSSITSLNSQPQPQQPNKLTTTKSGFTAKLSQSPPKSSILPKVPTLVTIPTPTPNTTMAYQNLEISKPPQRSRKQNDYSKLPIVNRNNSNPNSTITSHTKSSLIQDPSVGNQFSANLGINYYSQLSTASLYQPMDSSKHLNNNPNKLVNNNNRIASIKVSEVVSLQDKQQQQEVVDSLGKTQNSSHKQTKTTTTKVVSLDQFIDQNMKQCIINDDEIGDDEERLSTSSKSISMITEIESHRNHKSQMSQQQQQQSIKQPTTRQQQQQSLPFSSTSTLTSSINKETDCGVSDCYGSNGAANANVNNNSLVVASIGGFETMDSFNGKIEHQHLHALHRFRQQRKKGLLCRLRDVVISFSPRARYSILNRDHLFVRFGPDEWDALASFDFLQSFSTDLDKNENENVDNFVVSPTQNYRYQQQVETNKKSNTVMTMIDDDEIDLIEIDMEIEELLNYYCDISDDTDFDDEEVDEVDQVDEEEEEEMKQHSSLSLTNSTASSSSSSCCANNHNNNLEDNTGTKKNGEEVVESSSKSGRLKSPHQTKLLQLKQFTKKSRQNGRKAK